MAKLDGRSPKQEERKYVIDSYGENLKFDISHHVSVCVVIRAPKNFGIEIKLVNDSAKLLNLQTWSTLMFYIVSFFHIIGIVVIVIFIGSKNIIKFEIIVTFTSVAAVRVVGVHIGAS